MGKNASRILCLLFGLGLLPVAGIAGVIQGAVRAVGANAVPSPAGGGRPAAMKSSRASAMDDVIYLEEIPLALEKKLAKQNKGQSAARIAQRGGLFFPSVLPVAIGTTVTFENRDHVYHNVFSVSPTKQFDVGKYAPHETRQVTFDRPGLVTVFCDIDPNETGAVLVTPNHAFTRPDSTGSFWLPKLPPGKYTLCVWSPLNGKHTQAVEMPRHGNLSLTLGL